MKVIIDISEELYKNVIDHIKRGYVGSDVWIAVANGKPYEERPHGEWIRTALYGNTCLQCNQCGKADFDIKYDNFCPKCGADMRGDGKNVKTR